jgi:hypothetical protein
MALTRSSSRGCMFKEQVVPFNCKSVQSKPSIMLITNQIVTLSPKCEHFRNAYAGSIDRTVALIAMHSLVQSGRILVVIGLKPRNLL